VMSNTQTSRQEIVEQTGSLFLPFTCHVARKR
jgi:hypothetical protein